MVHVSIVGAGIGGLTTAVALHDVGDKVSVFEQAAEIADEGAGIQLTPNAGRLLCHLGLRPALDAEEVVSGKDLSPLPDGRGAEKFRSLRQRGAHRISSLADPPRRSPPGTRRCACQESARRIASRVACASGRA